MRPVGIETKAAADRQDADVHFDEWLSEGDTLTDATAEADPDGLVVESVQLFDTTVKVWLSGGEAGDSYTVTVTVTTQQGRIKSACFQVRVSDCGCC